MTKQDDFSEAHLRWLVESRSENQRVALSLFLLLRTYRRIIRQNPNLTNTVQGLVAATFSLWRAVFLSDSEGDSIKLIEDAEIFLGNLIRDNAVAYLQDRNAREWTFTYYVNNARYRLEVTSQQTPEIVPPKMVERLSREPKEDWTYYHLALTQAVENLTKILDH